MSTLDLHQAAEVAKCHPDTLRKMAKAGEVPATKIGRAWVFHLVSLRKAIPKIRALRQPKISRRRLRYCAELISSQMTGDPAPPPPPETHREALVRATPEWSVRSECLAFYRMARELTQQTGIRHGVDHILPLRGELVCGLHVSGNLRVVTVVENSRKCNRMEEAL